MNSYENLPRNGRKTVPFRSLFFVFFFLIFSGEAIFFVRRFTADQKAT